MLLSTHTEVLPRRYGYEEVVKMYAEVGFDAYDATFFDMKEENYYFDENYLNKAISLRKVADENGVVCNQAHAPFPMHSDGDAKWDKKCFRLPKEALKSLRF